MRVVNWRDLKSMFILPCSIAHTRRNKAIWSCLDKETFLNKRVTAKEYTQCSLTLADPTPFNDWVWFSYVKTQTEAQMKIYKLIRTDLHPMEEKYKDKVQKYICVHYIRIYKKYFLFFPQSFPPKHILNTHLKTISVNWYD